MTERERGGDDNDESIMTDSSGMIQNTFTPPRSMRVAYCVVNGMRWVN